MFFQTIQWYNSLIHSQEKGGLFMSIYEINVTYPSGQTTTLKPFRGKVLLIVNTATGCGFTKQYEGLQQLYETYQKQGFEVLDFPCNQFGSQAPGSNEEINQFCTLHYATTFPRFAKIDVNGDNASPLYQWLKSQQKGLLTSDIKWNFTKFLIDRQGTVVRRYSSQTLPKTIEKDIQQLLNQ